MARPVYSYLFSVNSLAPGGHEDIVLDALFTYVVRDIEVFLSTTVSESMRLQVSLEGNTIWSFGIAGWPARPASWEGHVVVPGVFTLSTDCFGASGFVNYVISGYKLSAS
jgi:hypothetical protein